MLGLVLGLFWFCLLRVVCFFLIGSLIVCGCGFCMFWLLRRLWVVTIYVGLFGWVLLLGLFCCLCFSSLRILFMILVC